MRVAQAVITLPPPLGSGKPKLQLINIQLEHNDVVISILIDDSKSGLPPLRNSSFRVLRGDKDVTREVFDEEIIIANSENLLIALNSY